MLSEKVGNTSSDAQDKIISWITLKKQQQLNFPAVWFTYIIFIKNKMSKYVKNRDNSYQGCIFVLFFLLLVSGIDILMENLIHTEAKNMPV